MNALGSWSLIRAFTVLVYLFMFLPVAVVVIHLPWRRPLPVVTDLMPTSLTS